jgi:hypothetical protein
MRLCRELLLDGVIWLVVSVGFGLWLLAELIHSAFVAAWVKAAQIHL